jgi:hypothetical protein
MSSTAFPGWYVAFQVAVLQQLPRPEAGITKEEAEALSGNQAELKRRLSGIGQQDRISLPPLTHEHKFEDLIKRPDIYGFFGTISGLGVVKPSGKTLTIPHPKPLGKVTTEREMLRRFPGCKDLDGGELILAVKKLVPTSEVLLGAMVNAIIESEEGRANLIPTAVGTWTLGFCVQNGELQLLYCGRNSGGWDVVCRPVRLGYKWRAEGLFFLATDTLAL